MSQFVFVQAEHPSTGLEGITFNPADEDSFLASAASANFGGASEAVWSVVDSSGGADSLADEAREAVLAGVPLGQTLLGRFLLEQAAYGRSLCLFWGSDFLALPQPATTEELLHLVADQLQSDGSANWELYAYWQGVAAANVGSA